MSASDDLKQAVDRVEAAEAAQKTNQAAMLAELDTLRAQANANSDGVPADVVHASIERLKKIADDMTPATPDAKAQPGT